ncbi:ogr/Delta-like zinc finger family protein [Ralstonia solanacearum]|uniref:ogr/Delta-like zinc finger family protein n=1 Tax=Ralstonia solanacearum TaxID=305 RepID=UPI00168A9AA0|nr:ogr/Delta-like zinc finger family protein [Ralstonia solanacearum]MDB0511351.1 ogr/Delta-like zinc finger family protein [Ralstonia solanacearum]QNT25298.1 ogr/Delta-like zinc finger family protein [Ralstonia solanacearum]QNT62942.1 ogr/Delta-like zinc finger family protein [Ralstonia solanacearum]
MKITCPHCASRLLIRTSRGMGLLSRELNVQCPNVECAYTGVYILSAARTIAPSMKPNPKAYVPAGRSHQHPGNQRQLDLLTG